MCAGAQLNVRDRESGWTALHKAGFRSAFSFFHLLMFVLFSGCLSIARALIKAGASAAVRDSAGNTPLQLLDIHAPPVLCSAALSGLFCVCTFVLVPFDFHRIS